MATTSVDAPCLLFNAIIFAKYSRARTSGLARNSSEHRCLAVSAAAALPSVSSHSYIASCICDGLEARAIAGRSRQRGKSYR